MRQAFIDTLIQLAETDKDIWLLTADMGFGLVEPFAEKFPKRYINVGVAEQNMIGVATGLALEGKKVFCYSIANFPTMRCLEQIRNDICYHNLPVCIMSGGAGLWYGTLGMTHHAVEDIAVMRCLPNMAVVSPYSVDKMVEHVNDIHKEGKPCYLRISKTSINPLGRIYSDDEGEVILLPVGGRMVEIAEEASQQLSRSGLTTSVLPVVRIKPLNENRLSRIAENVAAIITIKEHSKIGGLGSAVAEVLAGLMEHPPLVRLGTDDCYPTTAMSYEELLKANHLDVDGIVKEVLDALR